MALGVGKASISEMRICQKLVCFLSLGYLHCENAIATHETVDKKQQTLGRFLKICMCETGKLQSRPILVQVRSMAKLKVCCFAVSSGC